ncbi:hypothetical protein BSQ44_09185 [Aquibium oceanicum]|uniref:Uncharacterized protein n=1 Tax=Aquibium oceanicum TaxID=1670800 RepID=A0A1L3SQ21_9HYPH|nr:hypothetical protein BSQ44_09185 [Aquibium oceanicum]
MDPIRLFRIFSHRPFLGLLVVLAAMAHLAAFATAAPLPGRADQLSLSNGASNAPALTSKAPQAEARMRLFEPKRFADAEPSGALEASATFLFYAGIPALDPAPADAGFVRAAIFSPGQRAPPAFLRTA